MNNTERRRLLAFIKDTREHITLINEAMESTKHPVDAIIGENLDHIYSELQQLEFQTKV